jgi:hypothetical protein
MARKFTKLQNIKNPIRFEIEKDTEVHTSNNEVIDMATIGFSEMNPSQNLKAKKQHEQKLKNR